MLGKRDFIDETLHNYLKHTGPSLSPFNAWVLLKGLETLTCALSGMMPRRPSSPTFSQSETRLRASSIPAATTIRRWRSRKRQMSGGGPMVAFDLKGDKKTAFRFMNALEVFNISNNLGDAKSLVTHPATTTHQRLSPEARAELGISDQTIRLSIGLEDADDLITDLDHALSAAG